MTIDPRELVNLDVTIANFILPRLRAFRDATDSFPADLDEMGDWHDELDRMIAAFDNISGNAKSISEYGLATRAGVKLFARRLEHLWQ